MRAERILFGPLLRLVVRATISGYPSVAPRQIVNDTWDKYDELAPSIPKQKNFGAALIVRGAALTIAFYNALIARGFEPPTAQTLVAAATWKIYRVMGRIPWLAARVATRDPHRRLLLATGMFRRFPFGSPSYLWKDVDGDPGVVGFDCLRCPVAEYFKSRDEAALCVATFCQLDFPLATRWGAELVRSGSIAGGSERCDFRWRVLHLLS
jgi:L-2-amino-thiazoline-4-carboxylic acid hydrolase